MKLYKSQDDGRLYQQVDDPEGFDVVEVADEIRLTPAQLCGNNDIFDMLVRAGQATRTDE
jgi:hypothetical protein